MSAPGNQPTPPPRPPRVYHRYKAPILRVTVSRFGYLTAIGEPRSYSPYIVKAVKVWLACFIIREEKDRTKRFFASANG